MSEGALRPGVLAKGVERTDLAIAFGLCAAYVAVLFATADSLGYARDEGFYIQCARGIERWFELLAERGFAAFERASIDAHFGCTPEHPGLMKTLFALSHHFLHARLELVTESGSAYRLPGMAMAGLAVAVIYLWGREALGRVGGFVAALAFAWMPRVFFHAHLACFDIAAATMWLVTSYAYSRSFSERRLGWAVATGVLYGLFLDTKHNAWLFPFAVGAHLAVVRAFERGKAVSRSGPLVPRGLIALLVLGPAVFFVLWPWIWFDTVERLTAWVKFHLHHDYYNMEFLGRTYWKPPMPRAYAWVMTLSTVPAILLLLFVLGFVDSVRSALRASDSRRFTGDALWVVGLLVSYAPWLSNETPIFGGTKHWMTAYPFLCLLAGRGFVVVRDGVIELVERRAPAGPRAALLARAIPSLLAFACLAGPAVMALHAHPFGLTFYTPLVGGAPGAASLGLNRTFWGYTTGALAPALNARAPGPANVYIHDTAVQSWEVLRRDERIRPDLRGTLAIHFSRYALYHHEPHMQRVEHQIWVDYGTAAPFVLAAYDGVPVAWAYERPPTSRQRNTPAGTQREPGQTDP